jgi:hypothetical protein
MQVGKALRSDPVIQLVLLHATAANRAESDSGNSNER